jgi:glycerol-3-phosphate acyltransferase PlsX
MRIGLDIMGGDYAPQAPLEGVKLALESLPGDVRLSLIGDEQIIGDFLDKHNLRSDRVQIIPSSNNIEMGESPTKAVSQKPDSSIVLGLKMLAGKKLDIFISAGNTGAVYVGALYTVKAIEGVSRPAITSLIPKEHGGFGVILDVGANADVKPEVLQQFGTLGAVYARSVLHIENPKVGLLNIGSEPEKGNLLCQAAYPLFESSERFEFVGNVEGYDLFGDHVDVIACDGFTGNVVLKTAETIYQIMKRRGLTDEYFRRYDYEEYGGTPILGVNAPVMIAHGVSSSKAFKNMLHMGVEVVESQLVEKIKLAFEPITHG